MSGAPESSLSPSPPTRLCRRGGSGVVLQEGRSCELPYPAFPERTGSGGTDPGAAEGAGVVAGGDGVSRRRSGRTRRDGGRTGIRRVSFSPAVSDKAAKAMREVVRGN